MSEHNTVTNMAIRSAYDVLAEVLGVNARNIIFRAAGLSDLLHTPPGYTWERGFTNKQQIRIYSETIELIGAIGGQGILRLIGYKTAEVPVVRFGVLDHMEGLPKRERLLAGVRLLRDAINKGKIVEDRGGLPAYDVFDCLICSGIRSTKSYCANYTGSVQFVADWAYGRGVYQAREAKCMALGDETCLVVLEERA